MFPVDNIRAACKAKGTTISKMEKALKIGNGVVAKWEKSPRNPPYDRIVQIAEYLEVPVSQLTGEKEKPANLTVDELSQQEKQIIETIRSIPLSRRTQVQGLVSDLIQSLLDVDAPSENE